MGGVAFHWNREMFPMMKIVKFSLNFPENHGIFLEIVNISQNVHENREIFMMKIVKFSLNFSENHEIFMEVVKFSYNFHENREIFMKIVKFS